MINLHNAKLITHKNCSDGATVAILFIVAGGKRENIIFSNPLHHEVDKYVEDCLYDLSCDMLILADISMSLKMAESVDGRLKHELVGCPVKVFDHHKTANDLDKFSWCIIDKENSRCGSKIFYDWLVSLGNLNPGSYEELVKFVDDRDRWQKKFEHSDILASLFQIVGQKNYIERFLKNPDTRLTPNEKYVVDLEAKKLQEYIEEKKQELVIRKKNVQGKEYSFAFVISDKYLWNSDLGNSIVEDPNLNIDVAIMISNTSISARAKQTSDIDLSSIAKANGGGGHRLAAGWPTTNMLGESLEHLVEKRIKL